MKAWSIKQPGDRDQLKLEERDKPVAKEGQILVEVKASGINRHDIMTRTNENQKPPYPIIGLEVAGTVVENISDRSDLEPGTRVMGLVNYGGYGEFAVMPAERAIILPENLSFEEGAAIPEVFLTAFQTLYWLGNLKEGETVLIHAGGSGVGTAAIQMARQVSNAKIITTAGQPEKLAKAKSLGADIAINYKESNFADKVLQATDNRGVDLILDFVGASYWNKNLQSIAVDGRWVLIGTLGGSAIDEMDLFDLIGKRITLMGTLLTPRSDTYKGELAQDFSEKIMPYFQQEKIKPLVYKAVPFNDLPEAHRIMEDNENFGSIVLVH